MKCVKIFCFAHLLGVGNLCADDLVDLLDVGNVIGEAQNDVGVEIAA
jgi:hypothetical protein